MGFKFVQDELLEEITLITPDAFSDERGWFSESYKKSEFRDFGISSFSQLNRSFSKKKGTIRGLHFQVEPFAQGKLVQCLMGSIFDVAVDIRIESPNFGKYSSYLLSGENRDLLWIPKGFAHGFQTLEDDTEVIYLTTDEYSPEHDRSILWSDSKIGIIWPIVESPILSIKDSQAPNLHELLG